MVGGGQVELNFPASVAAPVQILNSQTMAGVEEERFNLAEDGGSQIYLIWA